MSNALDGESLKETTSDFLMTLRSRITSKIVAQYVEKSLEYLIQSP